MNICLVPLHIFIACLIFSCKNNHHVEYHENGLLVKMDYSGDTLNNNYIGEIKVYYPSGELKQCYEVKNSMKENVFKEYFKSGKLKYETSYKDDTIEGIETYYNPNGQVQQERRYKNGLPNGVSFSY